MSAFSSNNNETVIAVNSFGFIRICSGLSQLLWKSINDLDWKLDLKCDKKSILLFLYTEKNIWY